MTTVRSAVYKLYPTRQQEDLMDLFRKAVGYVQNSLVESCKSMLDEGVVIPTTFQLGAMARDIRRKTPWMEPVPVRILTDAAQRVKLSFEAYFKKSLPTARIPKVKSDAEMNSFTYTMNDAFRFASEKDGLDPSRFIRLGKIGFVRYRGKTQIKGKMKTATVSRRFEGARPSWYISITCEMREYEFKELALDNRPKGRIGIDLGLETRVATSEGLLVSVNRELSEYEKQISKLNSRMAGLDRNSAEYVKLKARRAHIYKKIRNKRADATHKLARQLALENDVLVMEDIPVGNIIDKSYSRERRKEIRDAAWDDLRSKLEYKCADSGCELISVNPAYTSQYCSVCGAFVEKDQTVRVHVCPRCGFVADRDINAAINILNKGLGLQAGSDPKHDESELEVQSSRDSTQNRE
ncbi:MAG: transposase [archaeon]|nr:transposase [archaeon]